MNTLNDLIRDAIGESEEDLSDVSAQVTVEDEDETTSETSAFDTEDAEKLAEALEFVGRRGLSTMLKEAGAMETNMGQNHKNTTKKQVGPHKDAPPMQPPGYGPIPTNADKKPGGGREVDTSGTGQRDHHPALGSNEAAINFTKKEKARQVSPALSAVLDQTPFADPKLREMLNHTETDKNIHAKQAANRDAIRAEMARRVASRRTNRSLDHA